MSPTPEERERNRTSALDHLAAALESLVPLVASQTERLDQLVPREEFKASRQADKEENHSKRLRAIVLICIAIIVIVLPLYIASFYATRSVSILNGATGSKAVKTENDVLAKIEADFDCSNEQNLQVFWNKLVEQGMVKGEIVFSTDNCLAAQAAAAQELQRDFGPKGTTTTTVTTPTGGRSVPTITTSRSRPITTTTATTAPPSRSTTTTTTTRPPPSSTTTTTEPVVCVGNVCVSRRSK